MRVRAFGISDVGKRREKNEDSYLVDETCKLFAVADGMGGHLGGDIASGIAISTLEEVITSLENDPDMTLQEGAVSIKPGEYQGYLRYAIKLASKRIFERAISEISLHGMGTTMVVILFRNGKAYIANVGDSRVYRVRDQKMTQITKDHSLVAEQMRAGILSRDDSRITRFKNIITRSVGFQEDVDADVDIRVIRDGDLFLLCSDGLSNMLRDSEISDIMTNNELEPACRRLIDIANERGGDDNITVVMAMVDKVDEVDKKAAESMDEPTVES